MRRKLIFINIKECWFCIGKPIIAYIITKDGNGDPLFTALCEKHLEKPWFWSDLHDDSLNPHIYKKYKTLKDTIIK